MLEKIFRRRNRCRHRKAPAQPSQPWLTPPLPGLSRLSASTICFRHFPLEKALEGIRAAGLGQVDLGTMPGFCPHFDFIEASEEEERTLVATVQASGLKVHTFTTHLGHVNDPEVDLETAFRAGVRNFRVARELGAVGVNLNCGVFRDRSKYPFSEDVDRVAGWLRRLAVEAENIGLRAMVEAPHKGNLIRTPEEAIELRRLVDHPNLELIYDINHHHAAGWDPARSVAALGADRIGIVHLRDAVGRGNAFPLGAGEIDLPAVFRELEAGGYRGVYSFEFTDAAPDFEGNVEMLRRSIAFIANLNP
ncbi:MAG: sugar phosphate isomerase/epimerase [Puniceicoccaceae bacterium]|nr:MAG: sugar phosphate isomerase/epimerase [Puniceicoccaceae bacterium]